MTEGIELPQENEKTIRNQTMQQNFHQRDKHLGCPTRKIHRIILKVDKIRALINEPAKKKIHDDAYGLTSQRQTICVEKSCGGGRTRQH